MRNYVVLLRDINVGGKNKVPMIALKECLERLGFANVSTYIASGNVLLESEKNAKKSLTMVLSMRMLVFVLWTRISN
jgi:uncharacterized protein (DUF1697 family)